MDGIGLSQIHSSNEAEYSSIAAVTTDSQTYELSTVSTHRLESGTKRR
jgi:hypothetical protein